MGAVRVFELIAQIVVDGFRYPAIQWRFLSSTQRAWARLSESVAIPDLSFSEPYSNELGLTGVGPILAVTNLVIADR